MSFWNHLPRPFFVLAPMEAVTDVVFRHVVKKAAAPDVYFTEFTNATGWAAVGDKATGGRLLKTDDEHPLVAQLWGAKPEAMAALSQHCAEVGFDGLDLNTGCPDSSATKSGAGSALIKNPELTAQLIAAMKTSGLPVSVKTRLGYSSVDERRDWITFLLEQDIVALTVHLRTKKEMSKVPAHWELMKEIRELRDQIAPQTLLIGNGDIMNKAEAAKLMQESGIDGVMVGRGIFHDPWFFEQNPSVHPLAEHIALLRYQLDLFEATWADQPRSFDPLKRFFKVYVRNFPEAAHVRDQLMHTRTIPEARAVLDEAFGPVLS